MSIVSFLSGHSSLPSHVWFSLLLPRAKAVKWDITLTRHFFFFCSCPHWVEGHDEVQYYFRTFDVVGGLCSFAPPSHSANVSNSQESRSHVNDPIVLPTDKRNVAVLRNPFIIGSTPSLLHFFVFIVHPTGGTQVITQPRAGLRHSTRR